MDSDKPAFPNSGYTTFSGMTKREYIATQILSGIMSDLDSAPAFPSVAAAEAVKLADALLTELAKPIDTPTTK